MSARLTSLPVIDLRIDEECRNPEFMAGFIAASHEAAVRRCGIMEHSNH